MTRGCYQGQVRTERAVPGFPGVEVRRGADRFRTDTEGRRTWHSFSFDRHYDPANVEFGPLIVHNDERVDAGSGYPPHAHRDVEILTWVLDGSLRHEDDHAHLGTVAPGVVQRLYAGGGVVHSEVNGSPDQPVRFVQMWVRSDGSDAATGAVPAYGLVDVGAHLDRVGWVTLAAGAGEYAERAAVTLTIRGAALHVARLIPRESLAVPQAALVHLYVCRGTVSVEGVGRLEAGDAARLRGSPLLKVTARSEAEVLLWQFT